MTLQSTHPEVPRTASPTAAQTHVGQRDMDKPVNKQNLENARRAWEGMGWCGQPGRANVAFWFDDAYATNRENVPGNQNLKGGMKTETHTLWRVHPFKEQKEKNTRDGNSICNQRRKCCSVLCPLIDREADTFRALQTASVWGGYRSVDFYVWHITDDIFCKLVTHGNYNGKL